MNESIEEKIDKEQNYWLGLFIGANLLIGVTSFFGVFWILFLTFSNVWLAMFLASLIEVLTVLFLALLIIKSANESVDKIRNQNKKGGEK